MPQKKLVRFAPFQARLLHPGIDPEMILRLSLYVLASWVLAAHFLRQELLLSVLVCVAMPLLFLVRRRWSRVVLQSFLYGAAVLWAFTAAQLADERIAAGLPWQRAAAILVMVGLVSLCAGLLLNSRVAKSHF